MQTQIDCPPPSHILSLSLNLYMPQKIFSQYFRFTPSDGPATSEDARLLEGGMQAHQFAHIQRVKKEIYYSR